MGLVIVLVVGAIMGWLASIVVERGDRLGAVMCAFAGAAGAIAAALLAGDVPLATGVSAPQLLWGVGGALLAIIATNALFVARFATRFSDRVEVFDNPTDQRHHRPRPF